VIWISIVVDAGNENNRPKGDLPENKRTAKEAAE